MKILEDDQFFRNEQDVQFSLSVARALATHLEYYQDNFSQTELIVVLESFCKILNKHPVKQLSVARLSLNVDNIIRGAALAHRSHNCAVGRLAKKMSLCGEPTEVYYLDNPPVFLSGVTYFPLYEKISYDTLAPLVMMLNLFVDELFSYGYKFIQVHEVLLAGRSALEDAPKGAHPKLFTELSKGLSWMKRGSPG